MRDEFGVGGQSSVLTPSVPMDIGLRSQRQRILDAMADSCAEKSFSVTTIADVVGRASISRATFYKHFANKLECFEAAVQDFVEELAAVAAESQTGVDSEPEAALAAIDVVLAHLAAKPAYAKLLAIEAPILSPGIVIAQREKAVGALEKLWQSSKTNGNGNGNGRGEADPRVAFGRSQVLVADLLAGGEAEQLPSLQPDLAYALLLPFVGHRKALAQLEDAP
jgi:AcrR family transcriptional regulator